MASSGVITLGINTLTLVTLILVVTDYFFLHGSAFAFFISRVCIPGFFKFFVLCRSFHVDYFTVFFHFMWVFFHISVGCWMLDVGCWMLVNLLAIKGLAKPLISCLLLR